ncbi:MAG: glycosyltransferase [Bacteroidetes bacterium]|nr:glycosyltransferase [Bacteroidota bacterium]
MYLPLVSIVIPCYNCELYIEETLTSILNQSYVDIEIIIIDDGHGSNCFKVNEFKEKGLSIFIRLTQAYQQHVIMDSTGKG